MVHDVGSDLPWLSLKEVASAKLGVVLALCATAFSAAAGDGKLRGAGGLISIEGSAGGGISPWAVIAGYNEADQASALAASSRVETDDYQLQTNSVAIGAYNRVELSLTRQTFAIPGARLGQDILGAKVRFTGDLIYGPYPQVSLGAQYKRSTQGSTLSALGIRDQQDVDFYASVSRLFLSGPLDRSWLVNATVRSTKAQQTGLLGFSSNRKFVLEGSTAMLLNRYVALGLEYKTKPDELSGLREDDWKDVFLAWFPNKKLTLAVAYVDLGEIATRKNQNGYFFTLQGQF